MSERLEFDTPNIAPVELLQGVEPGDLPRLAMQFSFPTHATRRAQVKILLIARTTVDHMLPMFIPLNILVSGRSSREIL
jgi:hypothetical protein